MYHIVFAWKHTQIQQTLTWKEKSKFQELYFMKVLWIYIPFEPNTRKKDSGKLAYQCHKLHIFNIFCIGLLDSKMYKASDLVSAPIIFLHCGFCVHHKDYLPSAPTSYCITLLHDHHLQHHYQIKSHYWRALLNLHRHNHHHYHDYQLIIPTSIGNISWYI